MPSTIVYVSIFVHVTDDDNRFFQLNICGDIEGSKCSSPLCEVNSDGVILNHVFPQGDDPASIDGGDYDMLTSFDELSNVVTLKYLSKDKKIEVILDFSCKELATDPEIEFLSNSESKKEVQAFHFRILTKKVCMYPSVPCEVEEPLKGNSYDLSALMSSNQNWVAYDGASGKQYHLAVCKPLSPSSTLYNCPGLKTAACQTNTEPNSKEYVR